MHPTVVRLCAYREAADLSYERLALDIAATTGRAFSASTLLRLCKGDVEPIDRTLAKLQQFLTVKEAHAKRRAPHRRRRGDR